MSRPVIRRGLAAVAFAASLSTGFPALAQTAAPHGSHGSHAAAATAQGSIRLEQAWTRAMPSGAPVAGGYVKITNAGAAPDRLVGGSFAIARRFEIHEMAMSDGVMKMRALPQGLVIEPGQTVELKPGSFHMMLMDLTGPIRAGDRLKGTLVFEKAGPMEVELVAAPVGATKPGGHAH